VGSTVNIHVRKDGRVIVNEETALKWLAWLTEQAAETVNVRVDGTVIVYEDGATVPT